MAKKFDLAALMGAGEVPKLDKVNCPKGAKEDPLEDTVTAFCIFLCGQTVTRSSLRIALSQNPN